MPIFSSRVISIMVTFALVLPMSFVGGAIPVETASAIGCGGGDTVLGSQHFATVGFFTGLGFSVPDVPGASATLTAVTAAGWGLRDLTVNGAPATLPVTLSEGDFANITVTRLAGSVATNLVFSTSAGTATWHLLIP